MGVREKGRMEEVQHALRTRLLTEFRKSGLFVGSNPRTEFADLYRSVADHLCEQVSRDNGYPPMTKQEVDMMCRCTITCQTLEQAIFCARDFCLMLQPRAAGLCLEVSADVATFSMKTVRRQSSSAGCLLDLTGLLCFMHLFGWLIGRPLRPKSVFLAHPRRDDAGPFVGLFGAFVQFGAFASGFTFDAALLSRRVVRQPVELGKFLEDLPFGLVTRSSGSSSVTEKITGAIEASISNGDPLPGLAELAVMFDMSSVTLRRRLASEGTSYNELRSRCLGEAAKHYLRNTKWTIDEISGRLGFSSAAAFRRAFACWGNCSPTEYRRTFEAE